MVIIPLAQHDQVKAPLKVKLTNYQWRCIQKPPVAAELLLTEHGLQVSFTVQESEPLVTVREQLTPPALTCKDSAVEVFLAFPLFEDATNFKPQLEQCIYTNIEINAAGICYAEYGLHREPRSTYNAQQVADLQIKTQVEQDHWTCSLTIPRSLIIGLVGFDGFARSFGINLYKISETPACEHYVSWHKVEVEKPNFHLPEFFALAKSE